MAIKDIVPCWILNLFNVNDGNGRCIQSQRVPSADQRSAWEMYNTITRTPEEPIVFYVNGPNGQRVKRTVTMEAAMSLGSSYKSTAARLKSLLDGAVADGWLTERVPTEAERQQLLISMGDGKVWPSRGLQKRDHSFAYPEEILRFPGKARDGRMADPYYPANPNLVPSWYPQLSDRTKVLYPTQKFNDPTFPNQRLMDFYRDIIRAIIDFDRDRNAVTAFHPLTVLCLQPFFVDPATYTSIQPDVQSYIGEWQSNNGDGRFLQRMTMFGVQFVPGDPERATVNLVYPVAAHWMNSLIRRSPITTHIDGVWITRGTLFNDEPRRTWGLWTADAQLEVLRWANAAYVRLQTSDAAQDARAVFVDMFAVQAMYKRLLTRAYEQAQRPLGEDLDKYSAQVRREGEERKRLARSAAIGGVVPGYNATGDDASDISSYCIGSIGLIVQGAMAAGPAGAVAMGLMVVANGLFAFLSSPEAPRDRSSEPLRVAEGGPVILGLTPRFVTESWPLWRVARPVQQ